MSVLNLSELQHPASLFLPLAKCLLFEVNQAIGRLDLSISIILEAEGKYLQEKIGEDERQLP